MQLSVYKSLSNAIDRCNGKIVIDKDLEVNEIYPFTTENINGYIDNFELDGKSLLTVGSSGDQIINALLKGCKDITLLDKNRFAKYYYYLKVAGLICLEQEEFLTFFRFRDYPNFGLDNMDVFKKELFEKLRTTLYVLDDDSYFFWNELFSLFKPIVIRDNLFTLDEEKTKILSKCNLYMKDEKSYNMAKERVQQLKPKFIHSDLLNCNLNTKYDNIWLSNVSHYLSVDFFKIVIDKMVKYLNDDGKLLISYLYETTIDTPYEEGWNSIYDLPKIFDLLKKYYPKLISFIGINGIDNDSDEKDSILVYTKK